MRSASECASTDLVPHPAKPPAANLRLRGGIERPDGGGVRLAFVLDGELHRLRIPDRGEPARADGLWEHTCFEAFLMPAGGEAYFEFNFSPSGAWAGYAFTKRRTSMRPLTDAIAPVMTLQRYGKHLELDVEIELAALARGGRAALAAVLEDDAGALSHWALAHYGDQPDFHDPTTFRLDWPHS